MKRSPMKRGRKRKASEFARIYGSRARVAFVQALPCIVCGSRPSENMHIKGDGISRKADYTAIVPACDLCHAEAHQYGIKTFERRHHLNLECLAAATEERWQQHVIAVLHTTDPLCARCKASFREEGSAFCGSCKELNRQERPAKAQKRPPRDAA